MMTSMYISVDQAKFSFDGHSIISCSVIGTISLYRSTSIGIPTLCPIEQYCKLEMDEEDPIFMHQQIDLTNERLCSLEGAYYSENIEEMRVINAREETKF
jgi:hypothetical protein